MKNANIIRFNKSILLFTLLLVSVVLLNSCAQKINFAGSSVVPAAEGNVKIKKDKNNNYSIQVAVSNLAGPERLQPPRKLYIVWVENAEGTSKSIGQITTSSSRLSKALKASITAVTTFKPTRVFITAEDDGNIQNPKNLVVLSTEKF